jgi:hypothetical protein
MGETESSRSLQRSVREAWRYDAVDPIAPTRATELDELFARDGTPNRMRSLL